MNIQIILIQQKAFLIVLWFLWKSEHEFYLCINCACIVSQPKSYCMNIIWERENWIILLTLYVTCPLLTLTKWHHFAYNTHLMEWISSTPNASSIFWNSGFNWAINHLRWPQSHFVPLQMWKYLLGFLGTKAKNDEANEHDGVDNESQ